MEKNEQLESALRVVVAMLIAFMVIALFVGLAQRKMPHPISAERQARAVRQLTERMEALERSEIEIRAAINRLKERYPVEKK